MCTPTVIRSISSGRAEIAKKNTPIAVTTNNDGVVNKEGSVLLKANKDSPMRNEFLKLKQKKKKCSCASLTKLMMVN
jgi:hypothetical protein